MLSHTFFAGATWLLLAVGCGPSIDPGGAKLDEPWRSMNLPVGDGVADPSDGDLHVAYAEGQYSSPVEAVEQWDRAIVRAGWKEKGEPYRVSQFLVVEYEREGQPLTLMVSGNGKRVDVQLMPE